MLCANWNWNFRLFIINIFQKQLFFNKIAKMLFSLQHRQQTSFCIIITESNILLWAKRDSKVDFFNCKSISGVSNWMKTVASIWIIVSSIATSQEKKNKGWEATRWQLWTQTWLVARWKTSVILRVLFSLSRKSLDKGEMQMSGHVCISWRTSNTS